MSQSKIPFLDLKAHHDPIRQEVMAAMNEVIDDWAARKPTPDMQGRILAVNVYSDVAAQVLFDFNGIYLDAFQLAKIDGRWRIVNKFYIGQ